MPKLLTQLLTHCGSYIPLTLSNHSVSPPRVTMYQPDKTHLQDTTDPNWGKMTALLKELR